MARLGHLDPPRGLAIACGAGWSTIAIARAYPNTRVDDFDLDGSSIDLARANLAALTQRVSFKEADIGAPTSPVRTTSSRSLRHCTT